MTAKRRGGAPQKAPGKVRPKKASAARRGAAKKVAPKRGGAPQKAPGGLGKVIYVRAWGELVDALDRRTRADRKSTGFSLSRSDVARNILARDLGVSTPLDAVGG